MKSRISPRLLALCILVGSGCTTGVNGRIRDSQPFFDTLPDEHRALIARGEIAAGFSQDEVRIAKGEPAATQSQWKNSQELATWTYTQRTLVPVPAASSPDNFASPWGYPTPDQPLQKQPAIYDEKLVLTVHFADGRVTDWLPH